MKNLPPIPLKEEIVNVAPDNWSLFNLRFFASIANSLISSEISTIDFLLVSLIFGTISPFAVSIAIPILKYFLITIVSLSFDNDQSISGKCCKVSAVDLTMYARGEILLLLFNFFLSFNNFVKSISSCWVT